MSKILRIFLGCLIVSFGVIILQYAGLLTGGTAGLSLALVYVFNLPFSFFFFVINIPFYIFSFFTMGWKFTASTIFAVSTLSLMTSLEIWLPAVTIPPLLGAVLGGIVVGLGISYLFTHGASLGGAHILALFLQKKFQFNPGKVNFIFDFIVISLSVFTVGILNGFYSIVSIFVLSFIISYFKGKIATNKTETQKPKAPFAPAAEGTVTANS